MNGFVLYARNNSQLKSTQATSHCLVTFNSADDACPLCCILVALNPADSKLPPQWCAATQRSMHSKNNPVHLYISVSSLHFLISHYNLNCLCFIFLRGLCTAQHPSLIVPIHSPFVCFFRFVQQCFMFVYYTSSLFATVSYKIKNTCIKTLVLYSK